MGWTPEEIRESNRRNRCKKYKEKQEKIDAEPWDCESILGYIIFCYPIRSCCNYSFYLCGCRNDENEHLFDCAKPTVMIPGDDGYGSSKFSNLRY